MRKILKAIALSVVIFFFAAPIGAKEKEKKEGFPGGGESVEKSNAPSTGTQETGKERAAEVGEGKKKGLSKEETAAETEEAKTEEKEKKEKKEKKEHAGEEVKGETKEHAGEEHAGKEVKEKKEHGGKEVKEKKD